MGSSSSKQIVDIEDNSPKEFKFCVIGEKEVGKTWLVMFHNQILFINERLVWQLRIQQENILKIMFPQ